jgi:hypothetical protein
VSVRADHLKSGHTTSCGCIKNVKKYSKNYTIQEQEQNDILDWDLPELKYLYQDDE